MEIEDFTKSGLQDSLLILSYLSHSSTDFWFYFSFQEQDGRIFSWGEDAIDTEPINVELSYDVINTGPSHAGESRVFVFIPFAVGNPNRLVTNDEVRKLE